MDTASRCHSLHMASGAIFLVECSGPPTHLWLPQGPWKSFPVLEDFQGLSANQRSGGRGLPGSTTKSPFPFPPPSPSPSPNASGNQGFWHLFAAPLPPSLQLPPPPLLAIFLLFTVPVFFSQGPDFFTGDYQICCFCESGKSMNLVGPYL